jgi:CRP-like cAMP-binding protein
MSEENVRHALTTKLENFVRLSADERGFLDEITSQRVRQLDAREDIVREGESPAAMMVMLGGWACSYKMLEDGRRQILNLLLPGDVCNLDALVSREWDHSIATITAATVAEVSRTRFDELLTRYPRLWQALWWESMVSSAIQREWTVNLGQRDAFERVAHLLCELFMRLEAAGLTQGDSSDFPLTQTDLGDATGLSTVHVNRTLRGLREAGLIALRGHRLRIFDMAALRRHAMFNANYLHLDHEGRHLDASVQ